MNRLLSFRQATFAVAVLTVLAVAFPAAADNPVPFRGYAVGVITITSPPPIAQLTGAATGEATHLGRYTRTETVELNFFTLRISGTVTFTAANGDLLVADLEGDFIPGTPGTPTTAVGTYRFRGTETGRFRNASGVVPFVAVTPDLVNFAVTFDGTIDY